MEVSGCPSHTDKEDLLTDDTDNGQIGYQIYSPESAEYDGGNLRPDFRLVFEISGFKVQNLGCLESLKSPTSTNLTVANELLVVDLLGK